MATSDNASLHPNLARLAAAYDRIIEQMEAGQLTAVNARARIAQLEARDDQGVRWSIDPDSGQFVRKTAFGEVEFDSPPRFGVMTADAYDYTGVSGDDDPNTRIELYAAPTVGAPSDLAGATQRPSTFSEPWWKRAWRTLVELPERTRRMLVIALVAVLALSGAGLLLASSSSESGPAPAPTAKRSPAAKKVPTPVAKAPARHPASR